MKDTCEFKECPFAKRMKLKQASECPNNLVNGFTSDKGETVMVNDCAPKRTLLMIQELFNRTVGLQQANEQQRNKTDRVVGLIERVARQKLIGAEEGEIIDAEPIPTISNRRFPNGSPAQ